MEEEALQWKPHKMPDPALADAAAEEVHCKPHKTGVVHVSIR